MKRLALVALFLFGCTEGKAPSGAEMQTPTDDHDREKFLVRLVDFHPGESAGFGGDKLPNIIFGPPHGEGTTKGSLDVVSLGIGGSITVELGVDATDGPGPDLIIFENAFRIGSSESYFVEPAFISVSADGNTYFDFPCDPTPPEYLGCAGIRPVFANPDTNDIDPINITEAGGDPFDLSSIHLESARFIRIHDAGVGARFGAGADGFDLDAIAAIQ